MYIVSKTDLDSMLYIITTYFLRGASKYKIIKEKYVFQHSIRSTLCIKTRLVRTQIYQSLGYSEVFF